MHFRNWYAAAIAAAILVPGAVAHAAAPNLFFSEHVEGSGFNKALEIYNGTGTAVDLSQYSIERYNNGGTDVTETLSLSGTLADGEVYVIAHPSADAAVLAVADLTSGIVNFNGDDVELLKHNGAIIDSFGQLGVDPGSTWGSGDFESKDHSLRRKSTICSGDADASDPFDPATEWDSFPKDSFDGLGSHTATCAPAADIEVSMADVSLDEGTGGTTPYDFIITLSQPAPAGGVTFDISTQDGSATAADADYVANSIVGASIPAGQTSFTFTVQVHGDTTPEPDEDFTVKADNFSNTAGMTITGSVEATGTIVNDDIAELEVYEIQGTGDASPWAGQTVQTSGIVTVVSDAGFYLQTPDARSDNDPLSSDGVYVYAANSTVSVGDDIELTANVTEYFGLTELSGISNLTILSSGNALPTAVEFDASTPSTDPAALSCGATNFECFEGMLVHIANGLVTQASGSTSDPNVPYDYIYVTTTGTRSLREPGLLHGLAPTAGDNQSAGVWDGNPEVFELSPNEFAGVNDPTLPIHGGSTFSATGVIGYSWGSYAFYPSALTVDRAPVPRPVPTANSGELTVASFNVERLCDDIDDTVPSGTDPIPPGKELYECSGGSLPTAAEYDQKAQRLADYIGTVLQLPDVVAVQEVENLGALGKLADKLEATYGVHYAARLREGNDISGIDVGYLINTSRVQVFAIQQLDKDLQWRTPNNHDRPVFDHPPLLLQGIFTGDGASEPFMVLVNHLKARSDVDDTNSNGDPTADALEAQEKRFRQAFALARLVQDLQTTYSARNQALLAAAGRSLTTGNAIPLLVVGDFNAYEFTDGFVDIVGMVSGHYDFDANLWDPSDLTAWNLQPATFPDVTVVNPALWNAIESLPVNERYSYLYGVGLGAIQGFENRKLPTDQALDHALLNQAARAHFSSMAYGRANQDAAAKDMYDKVGVLGVSDHDGLVVRLFFDRIFADGFEAAE